MTVTDEKTIIQACLSGNADAFEALVQQYQPRVVALAWNILGDGEDARDVAQDAFIQAFKNLDRFDLDRNFKSWLLGITAKRALDRIRKKNSFLKYFKHAAQRFSHEPPTPVFSLEESELFHPLLKQLNQRERTAISLKINEGYSAREIGQVLDCSEATVRVYLYKARKKLKKQLIGARETVAEASLSRCTNDV